MTKTNQKNNQHEEYVQNRMQELFVRIQIIIFDDDVFLTKEDRDVYLFLARYANWNTKTLNRFKSDTIIKKVKIRKQTYFLVLRRLEKMGLIKRTIRKGTYTLIELLDIPDHFQSCNGREEKNGKINKIDPTPIPNGVPHIGTWEQDMEYMKNENKQKNGNKKGTSQPNDEPAMTEKPEQEPTKAPETIISTGEELSSKKTEKNELFDFWNELGGI